MNETSDSKFMTITRNILRCKLWSRKRFIFNAEVLKSNLCDYTNACVLIRGNFTIIGYQATLAPFTKCITKIDGTPIDDAEELDLVMPMYNLMEYSSNYSERNRKVMVLF